MVPSLIFFGFNGGWIAVDNIIYRLSISLNIPEIFAVKFYLHCTEFWTFFGLQNFKGWCPQKLYPRYHPNLEARHVAKYRGATPTTPKVTGRTCWNLSQFWTPFEMFVGGKLKHRLHRDSWKTFTHFEHFNEISSVSPFLQTPKSQTIKSITVR